MYLKPYNRKPVIIGVILILLMALATVYTISKEFGFTEVINVIKSINALWLIPAGICAFMFSVGEAINIRYGLKIAGYKLSFLQSLKYALVGFFFSSITPSASGGQPAQLYFMHRDKIKLSHGSFSLMFELIGYEAASISIALTGLFVSLFGRIKLFDKPGLIALPIVGFFVNFIFLSIILLIMFSKKAVKGMARFSIWLVSLFSKKKNVKTSILKTFAEYRLTANKLKRNKLVLLKVIIVSILQFCAYHSITFFCYKAFSLNAQTLFEIMTLQGLLFTSVSAIPLPGSAGAMEGGFGLLFKNIFPASLLGSAIILCRLISFAFPLVYSGLFILIYSLIMKKNCQEKNS